VIAEPEINHVSISQMIRLNDIKPHPFNDKLYKPVDPNDPDVRALAQSIREQGVLDPLVLTSDYYILSGHRRRVAAMLAGLDEVPCRIEDVRSDGPDIPRLLATYNRQRVKTSAEMLREEVVLANPEESHRRLLQHRRRSARIDATDCIQLEGVKKRSRISAAKTPMLDAIHRALESYRKFWPVTDRQLHYALLNDPPLKHASKPRSRYANHETSYDSLCELLTRARVFGDIPYHAIHDPTRPVVNWNVFGSVQPFVRKEMNGFLKGYCRNLLQSQLNHIEIVGEKNTIESTLRPVAAHYCISFTIARGYASLAPRYEIAQRYKRSGKEKLVLLFLTDFDPEGEDIAHSLALSMRDDFGIHDLHPVKVGLTGRQVAEMGLPVKMTAKKGSSRRKKFVEIHGENVHELEAIPPDRLQIMLREAIDNVLDIDAFNAELDREKKDAAYLDGVRRLMHKQLAGVDGLDADAEQDDEGFEDED
jgi:hypothetical protein